MAVILKVVYVWREDILGGEGWTVVQYALWTEIQIAPQRNPASGIWAI